MRRLPEIHALLLAAGLSRRMAPHNKLLMADGDGTPMVARSAAALCASRVDAVTVVLGHQAATIEGAIRRHVSSPVLRFVVAPDFAAGLSASLKTGLAALPARASAVLVCLADMPLVGAAEIDAIIAAYVAAEGTPIVVPAWRGIPGNPVLWHRRFFADMLTLQGDTGARALRQRHAALVTQIEMASNAVLIDIDTPEARAGVESLRG